MTISNPILSTKNAVNLALLQHIYGLTEQIIDNLDEGAIYELSGGYERDVDVILKQVVDECYNVCSTNSEIIKTSSFQYLDKLTRSIEETFRCASLSYFCLACLPEFEVNWHHIEWANLVQIYQYLVLLAARGHGKSYFMSYAHAIWRLYRYQKKIHGVRRRREYSFKMGLMLTAEQSLGVRNLGWIRDEIEGNPILREKLYPGNTSTWRETKIKCKNGALLILKSFGSRLRGPHPHWVVLDDFLTENCIWSADIRAKYEDLFKSAIMPMLDKWGTMAVIGTPLSNLDLYAMLRESKRFKLFEYPAIFPDGTLLWENKFDFDYLIDWKEEWGSLVFSREILVRPVSSEASLFPHELMMSCTDKNRVLVKNKAGLQDSFKGIVAGLDFAISAGAGADYSVYITLGVLKNVDRYVLLNIQRFKGMNYRLQIAHLRRLYLSFYHDVMIAESNQMQQIFAQGMEEHDIPVEKSHTGAEKNDLKIGLPSLRVLFEQKKIILPYGNEETRNEIDMLITEFSSIAWTEKGVEGVGTHDDIPLAFWKAIEGCRKFRVPMFFTV